MKKKRGYVIGLATITPVGMISMKTHMWFKDKIYSTYAEVDRVTTRLNKLVFDLVPDQDGFYTMGEKTQYFHFTDVSSVRFRKPRGR